MPTPTSNLDSMAGLIQDIVRLQTQIVELLDELERPQLRPPASPEMVRRVEILYGSPLPISYLQFLSLHDGCANFTGAFNLLGTAEICSSEYARFVKEFRDKEWESANQVPVEGFVIGYDSESNYVVLLDRASNAGFSREAPVIVWEFEEISRSPSFQHFLVFWREVDEKQLKKLRAQAAHQHDNDVEA